MIENYDPSDLWRSLQLGQDLGELPIEIAWPMPKRLGGTVFRTEVLRKLSGYDHRYRTNYEDVDLSIRLLQAGYRLCFDPRAVMRHMRRDTFSSVLRTSWRWDFYKHLFHGGHNHLPLKILFNFRWARVLIFAHARSRRYSLLPLDVALPFVHSYHDMRCRFSAEHLPAIPPDPNSEIHKLYFPWPLRCSSTVEAEKLFRGRALRPDLRIGPKVCRAHLMAELGSQVQHSIPFVQVVLMFRGLNPHFRGAIPQVPLLAFVR